MELTVRTQDFARELALAQGVVEKKSTIPVLANVLLEAKEGGLVLTCTDLEISIRSVCSAEIKRDGSTTLPMRRLLDYVRLLPDAELSLSVASDEATVLTCGRATTRISGIDPKNFPPLPDMPEPLTRLPAAALAEAIHKTIISVASEESHYTLGAAQMVLEGKSLTIVSTDGHRLSLFTASQKLEGLEEKVEGLLPKKTMAELGRLLGGSDPESEDEQVGSIEFALDDKHMFFRLGPRLFVSRLKTGKFPDYTRVLPKDLDISLELSTEQTTAVLRRVSQFADERSHPVRLDLEDGKLQFKATRSDAGTSEESLLVDYDGGPFGVGFNALYILEFLGVCGSDKVLLRLKDPRTAAQMEVPGLEKGKDYRYVLMPIRV